MINLCVTLFFTYVHTAKSTSNSSANDFYIFKNAWATSTFVDPEGNLEEYSPLRVAQPGPSYWCSAGSHSPSDIVSWSGELSKQPLIESLTIDWVYAPKEYQISASKDGINYTSLIPFQHTYAEKASFTQHIKLPEPFLSKELKVSMKNPFENFFGISSIKIRAGGNPLFMIKSGITSEDGELCLVNKGDKPILYKCLDAITISSGMELWRFNSNQQLVSVRSALSSNDINSKDKCLAVPVNSSISNITTTLPNLGQVFEVFLADCDNLLDEDDSLSRWAFESNSQISLLSPQSLCLSQLDIFPEQNGKSLTGNVNLVLYTEVSVDAPGIKDHEIGLATDNKLETYWASPPFDLNSAEPFTLKISLSDTYTIDSIIINWEYPAFSYLFKVSLDNIAFETGPYNASNGSAKTIDIMGLEAKYIDLVLLHPHLDYKVKDKYLYGIREIQIMTNSMVTVVTSCKVAANSNDARDKFFIDYINQYDPNMSRQITELESNLVEHSSTLYEKSNFLQEKLDYLKDSYEQAKEYSDILNSAQKFIDETRGELSFDTFDTALIGESKNRPAESCQIIYDNNKHAASGFYWLNPVCSPFTYRAYCHMHQARSKLILLTKLEGKLSSLDESIRYTCARYGLEPLKLSDKSDYNALKGSAIAFGVTGFIPLGKDYHCNDEKCSGVFREFSGVESINSVISFYSNSIPSENDDLVGFTYNDGIMYKKSKNIILSHVACSNDDSFSDFQLLSCDDALIGNENLLGEINTFIHVECPSGCQHSKMPLYGSNNSFSETSPICKAAIQAGTVLDGGRFVIGIEGPLLDAANSKESDKKFLGRFSFRPIPLTKKCPIDFLTGSAHFTSHNRAHNVIVHELTHNFNLDFETDQSVDNSGIEIDPWTKSLSQKCIDNLDSLYGIDPMLSKHSVEEAIITCDKVSSKLNSLYKHVNKLFPKSSNILNDLQRLEQNIEYVYSESHNKSEKITSIKDDTEAEYLSSPKIERFTQSILKEDNLKEHLDAESHNDWKLVDTPYHSVTNYLAYFPSSKSLGLAIIKSHLYFNFNLSVLIASPRGDSAGIIFRYRDNFNYYSLTFNVREGETRLNVKSNGKDFILDTAKNGGLNGTSWSRVSITASGPLMKVQLNCKDSLFSVLDENIESGLIGLYSEGDCFYSNLTVNPLECSIPEKIEKRQLKCSTFVDEFLGTPNETYDIIGFNDNIHDLKGWDYGSSMLVQTSPLSIMSSMALFSHNRICKVGTFSFGVWPMRRAHKTKAYSLGAVFYYEDQKNFSYFSLEKDRVSIHHKKDGIDNTLKSMELGDFTFHQWNEITLKLSQENNVLVALKHKGKEIASLSAKIEGEVGDRIGLYVNYIARVLFKDIKLNGDDSNNVLLSGLEISKQDRVWSECLLTSYTSMLALCTELGFECNPFCANCCSHYTSLLNKEAYRECLEECNHINVPVDEKVKFDKYLESCSPLSQIDNKPHTEHCNGDHKCLIDACFLCCESGYDKNDRNAIAVCYNTCTKYSTSVNLKMEL